MTLSKKKFKKTFQVIYIEAILKKNLSKWDKYKLAWFKEKAELCFYFLKIKINLINLENLKIF
jgi:hypothetical protein